MLRGRAVRVVSDPPLPVFVDGEVIGRTPAEFTLAARAIEILGPAPARRCERP
jgi:diacylglycerol kinase family enzyme